MTTTTPIRPVGVDELKRAWRAVQAGQFRPHTASHLGSIPERTPEQGKGLVWRPVGPVLPVVGCLGQAGASTLAIALATAAGGARVVECCTATASGLLTATTAELGTDGAGWSIGRRGTITIARTRQIYLAADEVPMPADEPPDTPAKLAVLDIGWELGHILASPSWLATAMTEAPSIIAVTAPTVPGLRRLEVALTLLPAERVTVVIPGMPRRRWPRELSAGIGSKARAVENAGRLMTIPVDKNLALRGLDSTPLPTSLLKAAADVLNQSGVGQPTTLEGLR